MCSAPAPQGSAPSVMQDVEGERRLRPPGGPGFEQSAIGWCEEARQTAVELGLRVHVTAAELKGAAQKIAEGLATVGAAVESLQTLAYLGVTIGQGDVVGREAFDRGTRHRLSPVDDRED